MSKFCSASVFTFFILLYISAINCQRTDGVIIPSNVVETGLTAVGDTLGTVIGNVGTLIGNVVGEVYDAVSNTVQGVTQSLSGVAGSVLG